MVQYVFGGSTAALVTGISLLAGIILLAGYLLLRFNKLWIYRLLDNSLRNPRDFLPKRYEIPRYYKRGPGGEIDTSVRWPGWDGWYFFFLPDDRALPFDMIRGSLMTGLYGLDGVDNYDELRTSALSSFAAVEYLDIFATRKAAEEAGTKPVHLYQRYFSKQAALRMETERLDVAIGEGKDAIEISTGGATGKIIGAWPDYRVEFSNPRQGLQLELHYKAENILWWSDIPQIFTYFASFGSFRGTVSWRGGRAEPWEVTGRGSLEHGFARKPFNFDLIYSPITCLKKILPGFRPIRYHYELFVGDNDAHHGGFMLARGFGINARDLGGLYIDGVYRPVRHVEVEYCDDPPPDLIPSKFSRAPTKFYRKWKVTALTDDGQLEYDAERDVAPLALTGNMFYYHFSYAGAVMGKAVSGQGYGEYLHI